LWRVLSPLKWIAVPCLGSAAAGYLAQQMPLPLLAHTLLTCSVVLLGFAGFTWLAAPAWLKNLRQFGLTGASIQPAAG
jgi:hypothetical protein